MPPPPSPFTALAKHPSCPSHRPPETPTPPPPASPFQVPLAEPSPTRNSLPFPFSSPSQDPLAQPTPTQNFFLSPPPVSPSHHAITTNLDPIPSHATNILTPLISTSLPLSPPNSTAINSIIPLSSSPPLSFICSHPNQTFP